jgi:hypothetical protein
MEAGENQNMGKYKEIMNDGNYGSTCLLTPHPVLDVENFKCLIFVAYCLHDFSDVRQTAKYKADPLAPVLSYSDIEIATEKLTLCNSLGVIKS